MPTKFTFDNDIYQDGNYKQSSYHNTPKRSLDRNDYYNNRSHSYHSKKNYNSQRLQHTTKNTLAEQTNEMISKKMRHLEEENERLKKQLLENKRTTMDSKSLQDPVPAKTTTELNKQSTNVTICSQVNSNLATTQSSAKPVNETSIETTTKRDFKKKKLSKKAMRDIRHKTSMRYAQKFGLVHLINKKIIVHCSKHPNIDVVMYFKHISMKDDTKQEEPTLEDLQFVLAAESYNYFSIVIKDKISIDNLIELNNRGQRGVLTLPVDIKEYDEKKVGKSIRGVVMIT